MKKILIVAITLLIAACAKNESLEVTSDILVDIRGVSITASEAQVEFTLVNHTEKFICLSRQAFDQNYDSGADFALLFNKAGKAASLKNPPFSFDDGEELKYDLIVAPRKTFSGTFKSTYYIIKNPTQIKSVQLAIFGYDCRTPQAERRPFGIGSYLAQRQRHLQNPGLIVGVSNTRPVN